MVDPATLDHESYMRRALELAKEAADRGDNPYGSLLVHTGKDKIVMEDRNAVNTADDIRRHPELTLAKRAAREFSPTERTDLVMYTSTEPCPMCSGGIAIAGVGAVVYAVSGARATELGGGGDPPVSSETVLGSWGRDIPVVPDVLREEGERIHREHG